MKIKMPTSNIVKEYNKKFENDERYYVADQAIIKLLDKFRGNKDIINNHRNNKEYSSFLTSSKLNT